MCPVCSLSVQVPQVAASQEVVLIPSYWYLSLNADVTQHMDLQQAGLLMYRCVFLQQIIIKCTGFAQVANQLCRMQWLDGVHTRDSAQHSSSSSRLGCPLYRCASLQRTSCRDCAQASSTAAASACSRGMCTHQDSAQHSIRLGCLCSGVCSCSRLGAGKQQGGSSQLRQHAELGQVVVHTPGRTAT